MEMFQPQILFFFIAITFLQVLDVSTTIVGLPHQPRIFGNLPPRRGGYHRRVYRAKVPLQPHGILPPHPPVILPANPKPMLPAVPGGALLPVPRFGPGAGLLPFPRVGPGVGLVNYKLSREEQEYLNAHNAFRDKKQVPHLAWDSNLMKFAKTWATARSHDCIWGQHSNGPYGENIMWQKYDERSPTEIVNMWAAEENNWDHTKHACKCQPETINCQCGHYVAMVWKTTHRVGCATVTCDDEKGLLTVCEYDPKGQWLGMNPLNPHK